MNGAATLFLSTLMLAGVAAPSKPAPEKPAVPPVLCSFQNVTDKYLVILLKPAVPKDKFILKPRTAYSAAIPKGTALSYLLTDQESPDDNPSRGNPLMPDYGSGPKPLAPAGAKGESERRLTFTLVGDRLSVDEHFIFSDAATKDTGIAGGTAGLEARSRTTLEKRYIVTNQTGRKIFLLLDRGDASETKELLAGQRITLDLPKYAVVKYTIGVSGAGEKILISPAVREEENPPPGAGTKEGLAPKELILYEKGGIIFVK